MRHIVRYPALLALASSLAACGTGSSSAGGAPAPAPAPRIEGAAVRVTYDPAREVRLLQVPDDGKPAADSVRVLRNVRVVVGRVRMQRGDTLMLAPTEIVFAAGTARQAWEVDRSRLVVSASEPAVRIEVLSRWPRTVTLAAWVAFFAPLVILGAALSAMS